MGLVAGCQGETSQPVEVTNPIGHSRARAHSHIRTDAQRLPADTYGHIAPTPTSTPVPASTCADANTFTRADANTYRYSSTDAYTLVPDSNAGTQPVPSPTPVIADL